MGMLLLNLELAFFDQAVKEFHGVQDLKLWTLSCGYRRLKRKVAIGAGGHHCFHSGIGPGLDVILGIFDEFSPVAHIDKPGRRSRFRLCP